MCYGFYTQGYYRNSNGALIFVDLCDFKMSDRREVIRLQTKNLIQYLQDRTRANIPCLLIGTKVITIATELITYIRDWIRL